MAEKRIRYHGPAKNIPFLWRGTEYYFAKGGTYKVPQAFADYLIERNPDKLSLEEATVYGIPVFEEIEHETGGDF